MIKKKPGIVIDKELVYKFGITGRPYCFLRVLKYDNRRGICWYCRLYKNNYMNCYFLRNPQNNNKYYTFSTFCRESGNNLIPVLSEYDLKTLRI